MMFCWDNHEFTNDSERITAFLFKYATSLSGDIAENDKGEINLKIW